VGGIAEAHDSTYPQVALAWLLAQPTAASVILGARTMAQLEDNLGAADLALMPDEVAHLNEVSAQEEGYPYRMLRLYGSR
jgi:aryl-alcohol dehydrogenase-like predicted oxidoreductase